MITPEREAGEMYTSTLNAVQRGTHSASMLAGHIVLVVKGTVNHKGPLWKLREVPPEGKRIELSRFEDYLLKPPRDGLGLPSLLYVNNVLKAHEKGAEALEILRQEIPDFDARVKADADRLALKAAQPLGTTGGKREAGKKRTSPVGGTGRAYTLGRLKRDAADGNDTARDLLDQVEAGTLSASAAAIKAGYRPPMKSIPIDSPEAALMALERVFGRDALEIAFAGTRG